MVINSNSFRKNDKRSCKYLHTHMNIFNAFISTKLVEPLIYYSCANQSFGECHTKAFFLKVEERKMLIQLLIPF